MHINPGTLLGACANSTTSCNAPVGLFWSHTAIFSQASKVDDTTRNDIAGTILEQMEHVTP